MPVHLKKKANLVVIAAVVGALFVSNVGASLAATQNQDAGAKQGIFGEVSGTTANSLTVQTKQGESVRLAVDQDTSFRVRGEPHATLADVPVGSRVAVLAQGGADARIALKVMVVAAEPQREHRTLTVVEISGNTVITEDADGNRIEVQTDHELSEDVQGQLVTFIGAKSGQSNRFKANAEIKIANVVKRLERHSREVRAESEAGVDAEARAKKQREFASLKARLEANMQRHLNLFSQVIAKAPDATRPRLQAALEASLAGYKTALEAVGEREAEAKARLETSVANGIVEAVDTTANTITVRTHNDASVTVKVTNETKVQIGEAAGTLADVSTGNRVQARLDRQTKTASAIKVRTKAEEEGAIESFDGATGLLVLNLKSGATLELTVTSDSKIKVNDNEGTTADLQPNAMVEVEYDLTTGAVEEIKVDTTARVRGTVKSVDRTTGTITLVSDTGTELTLSVTDASRLRLSGLVLAIRGLGADMDIQAWYDRNSHQIIDLHARAKGDRSGHAHDDEEAKVVGRVDSVDADASEITVVLENGAQVTVRVTADTELRIDGKDGSLGDVATGTRVRAEYDTATMTAEKLDVFTEGRIRGRIALERALQDRRGRGEGARADVRIRVERQRSRERDHADASVDGSTQEDAGARGRTKVDVTIDVGR